MEAIQLLVERGGDVNARTKGPSGADTGGSVLYWALEYYDEDHELIQFLESRGAQYNEPSLEQKQQKASESRPSGATAQKPNEATQHEEL